VYSLFSNFDGYFYRHATLKGLNVPHGYRRSSAVGFAVGHTVVGRRHRGL